MNSGYLQREFHQRLSTFYVQPYSVISPLDYWVLQFPFSRMNINSSAVRLFILVTSLPLTFHIVVEMTPDSQYQVMATAIVVPNDVIEVVKLVCGEV